MPPHPAIQLIQSDPERFAAQGSIIATWRTYRGRRLGPYYRLTWREGHRQRSLYLGRDGPLVDQVRELLNETQEIRRLKREHRRNREHFRRTVIEPLENYVKDIFYLYSNGLYLKGWEVRGFSWGGSFRTDAEVPAHLIPEFPLPLPETLAQIHNQALAKVRGVAPDDTVPGGTVDFSADRFPLSPTPSENRQCCLQQEDPGKQTTSTRVPDQPLPSPTPSPEFSQSVTQNDSGGTVDFSADRFPLSPTPSENRRCCLQQEDPTDQTTSTHAPDQPTASPTRAPSLEIPQSVIQKTPSTPHHKYLLFPISVRSGKRRDKPVWSSE